MYLAHGEAKLPEDLDTKIWRYMDFTKFVSLLETRSLFFVRADSFTDPFEGTWPRASYAQLARDLEQARTNGRNVVGGVEYQSNFFWEFWNTYRLRSKMAESRTHN